MMCKLEESIVLKYAEMVSKMLEKSATMAFQPNAALLVKPCQAGIALEQKTQELIVSNFVETESKIPLLKNVILPLWQTQLKLDVILIVQQLLDMIAQLPIITIQVLSVRNVEMGLKSLLSNVIIWFQINVILAANRRPDGIVRG